MYRVDTLSPYIISNTSKISEANISLWVGFNNVDLREHVK